jgi:saccharopine dehydrogenase (NAD+, L-lysine forming)
MGDNTTIRPGVMIVGGYGHVGSQIARRLMTAGRDEVCIAGRDENKANAMAKHLGCKAARLDVHDPRTWSSALTAIDIVVVCIDQTDTGFVEHVLKMGLRYIDITADDMFFRDVEKLAPLARTSGGTALLSVGLAPGLTNLLVKACAEQLDSATEARIGILLGLGDTHGPAAIDWTLQNFKRAPIEQLHFGKNDRPHPAMEFNFADQHVLRRTRGIDHVRTLLTFDSPLLSRILFHLLPVVTKSTILRRLVSKSMMHIKLGSDRTALSIEAKGLRDGREAKASMALEGREEAAITALVAAQTVQLLTDTPIAPGVWHIDQVTSIERYGNCLAAEGVTLSGTA